MYNPKVKDFMESKPELTLMGLYWAGYWRLVLVIMIFYIPFMLIVYSS